MAASGLIDRAALEIALGGLEVDHAMQQVADVCLAAGAPGVRVRVGKRVVEAGTLPAHARSWTVDSVDVATTVDADVLARALAGLLVRVGQADDRRKLLHDLRGLVAVISGQNEMLSMSVWGPINPAQKKATETIARQIERMAPLLDRLRR